jgi:hypothetical protein
MLWLDPAKPEIRSAVASGAYGRMPHSDHGFLIPTPPTIDTIATALDAASDILTRLVAFSVHPALAVEEDFVAAPRATKLYPSFSPVRSITSVTRLAVAGSSDIQPTGWTSFGGAIYFSPDCSALYDDWFRGWCGHCAPARDFLRVAYHAGSTITASARQAVIALAHDIWLDGMGCEECGLPERTINVTRAGVSYNVGDSNDPLAPSLTGLPAVDVWIRAVNPHRAVRSASVYSPDSPPPVVVSVKTARPEWGSTVNLFGDVAVNITTASA